MNLFAKKRMRTTTSGVQTRRLVVALIHPSNYDHQKRGAMGSFVQTYRLGVIPSNTLRVMQSLTLDAFSQEPFDNVRTEVHIFEDSIRGQQRAFRRLLRKFPQRDAQLVVGLVAVQSNQFPRALDLIDYAKRHGAISVIGGPHVTASINTDFYGISAIDPLRAGVSCANTMPPEIQHLIDDPDVVVFHGDADNNGAWHGVLSDIFAGRPKPYYEAGLANELTAPGCLYDSAYLDDYVTPVAAVDTERGCPFKCKFCAAIQAHGRTVRCRPSPGIVDWIRRQCESYGKPITVLFASDNLARNPHWRQLLKGLQDLLAQGYDFTIWAEADVRCNSGPNRGFLEEYAKAGGQGLFLGIESMNPDNIVEAGKKQNAVDELPAFFAECRRHGIAPEGGYIIGFEHDTPQSIARDVTTLAEAGLARAWFFVKTLLPGSEDWAEARRDGKTVSDDLNDFDSTVVGYEHEHMTCEEWQHAYDTAIRTFYSSRSMVSILSTYQDALQRWRLIKGFMWCRWAYLTEKSHPMIAGFYRYRPFGERRPRQKSLSFGRYMLGETWRHLRYVGHLFREFYIFQQVILETECRLRFDDMRARLESEPKNLYDWFERTFRAPMRRAWLNGFWVKYGSQKWRLLNPFSSFRWHINMVPHAMTEVVYTMRFLRIFIRGVFFSPT